VSLPVVSFGDFYILSILFFIQFGLLLPWITAKTIIPLSSNRYILLYENLLMRYFLVPLCVAGQIFGFLSMNLKPASTCRRKSYPNPCLLSSYQEKAFLRSDGNFISHLFVYYSSEDFTPRRT